MRLKIIYGLVLFLLLINVEGLQATHNRAGEIQVIQIGDCNLLTVEAIITTYTKNSSSDADRDSLEICWGDGFCELVPRTNGGGNGEVIGNDTKKNIYKATHQYGGVASYTISMQDPNRNADILNVAPPFSVNVPFYIETNYTFLNPQFQGCNSTVQLLQPPIDFGCVGQVFIHNPNAYDIDKDSLAYELITPLRNTGVEIDPYFSPTDINPTNPMGPNAISLDPLSGNFVWETPQKAGEYNIAILIKEYRAGVLIATTIRDMQILITDCEDTPPEIDAPDEICVIAGDTLAFVVTATDAENSQKVKLTALGGPFEEAFSPATFQAPDDFTFAPVLGDFLWIPACESISNTYYSIVFKAEDNYFGTLGDDESGLSTLQTTKIKVIGPPPENVLGVAGTDNIRITWDKPYKCEDTNDDYFRGFSVWRKEFSNPFVVDTCETGLSGKGYTQIEMRTVDSIGGQYFYDDFEVEKGKTYCYRVLAHFALISQGGYEYNPVESMPSNEFCIQLKRDLPLLTKVDVLSTDINGQIEVNWFLPIAEELDTILNPGPYTLKLFRSDGLNANDLQPIPGAEWTSNGFSDISQVQYIDVGLNTIDQPYSYNIQFYTEGQQATDDLSPSGSSVFLSIFATDEKNVLSWQANVPWSNYTHTIYRFNTLSSQFDSIGISDTPNYEDKGLINGEEYCYKVKTTGSYNIENITDPIFNFSQELCAIPVDNVPPCAPNLNVINICSDEEASPSEFENLLSWDNSHTDCTETDDIANYNIFFIPNTDDLPVFLENIDDNSTFDFAHYLDMGLAGCYEITAIDSIGNESLRSNKICVDNCPLYTLPNTFTPNGDGMNDIFIPLRNRFIDHIDMKIFNQWGVLVFETEDKEINWIGQNINNESLNSATYYYKCTVFESRVEGVVESPTLLKGFIELVR